MKPPTDIDVEAEIAWLRKHKPLIAEFSAFGDSNHTKIDAEIETLVEGWDQDDIDDKLENGDWDEDEYNAARDVIAWRDEGDEDGRPSVNWGPCLSKEATLSSGVTNRPIVRE